MNPQASQSRDAYGNLNYNSHISKETEGGVGKVVLFSSHADTLEERGGAQRASKERADEVEHEDLMKELLAPDSHRGKGTDEIALNSKGDVWWV